MSLQARDLLDEAISLVLSAINRDYLVLQEIASLRSQRHLLMSLCHFRDIAGSFRVIAFDFRQVAGKQLGGDDAH